MISTFITIGIFIVLIGIALICFGIISVKHPELEEQELQEQADYLKNHMEKKEKK